MKKTTLKLMKNKNKLEYQIDQAIEDIVFLNKYVKKNHFLYELKKDLFNLNREAGIKKIIKNILIKFNKEKEKLISYYIIKNKNEILFFQDITKNKLDLKKNEINDLINIIEKVSEETIKNICNDLKKNYLLETKIFYKYILDYASFTHDKEKKEAIGIIIKNISEIIS